MNITDLPPEIFAEVLYHLDTFYDCHALGRTCRHLYNACAGANVTFGVSRVGPQGHQCLDLPHPLLLIGSGRQLADWAAADTENRSRLELAIGNGFYRTQRWPFDGDERVLDLCIEVTRWTITELRALVRARNDVIAPLARILRAEMFEKPAQRTHPGAQKIADDYINSYDVDEALCHYVFYCELFHYNIDQAYGKLPPGVQPLENALRSRWIAYTMPSPKYYGLNRSDVFHGLKAFPSFRKVASIALNKELSTNGHLYDEQYAGLSPSEIRFARIMQHQGLTTLRMLLPGGVSAVGGVLHHIREAVNTGPVQQGHEEPRWYQGAYRRPLLSDFLQSPSN